MSNEQPQREGNTILELAMFSCEEEIAQGEEIKNAYAKLDALLKKVRKTLGYDAMSELETCVAEIRFGYSREMFYRGWKLRGNPDLFASLIEPE